MKKLLSVPALSLLFSTSTPLSLEVGSQSRRSVLQVSSITLQGLLSRHAVLAADEIDRLNLRYNDEWTGTALSLLDISTAATRESWDMGRWPDPILRRPASTVDEKRFGTDELRRITKLLRQTCKDAGAVGLAAQQCGVDARVVYLEDTPTMINPLIIRRSPETDMRVWSEFCLVLPPSFRATVLRDAWVDVQYRDAEGLGHTTRLRGEKARAAQHELDHDRGILILDHVGLEDLENDVMRSLERDGHQLRMALAYSRAVQRG